MEKPLILPWFLGTGMIDVRLEEPRALGAGWLGHLGRRDCVLLSSLGSGILGSSWFLLAHVCLSVEPISIMMLYAEICAEHL